jgi:bisphosphoglycerate-independent phosphoglycerate mutase (AlkP superfamily)
LVAVLSEGDGPRLQWLLNGFLFVNVLHLVAIWGLGYLNEKKQNAPKEAGFKTRERTRTRSVGMRQVRHRGSNVGIPRPLLAEFERPHSYW